MCETMISETDIQEVKATCAKELKNPQYDKAWIGKRSVSLQLLTVIGIIDELLSRRRAANV